MLRFPPTRSGGEIGRRARLRIWFRKECGFKSLPEHLRLFPMKSLRHPRIGLAGWSEAVRRYRNRFPGEASTDLARYAGVFDFVEINSSFYRSLPAVTCAKWASEVPENFRFAVKMHRLITHFTKLQEPQLLENFFASTAGLGSKLAAVLVQLPPTLVFDATIAEKFFRTLQNLSEVAVVCEPRHPSWTEPPARELLENFRIGMVHTEITPTPPEENSNLPVYYRLHGSPRRYYSSYTESQLAALAACLTMTNKVPQFVVFDNTASHAGVDNALELQRLLAATSTPATPQTL